MRLPSDSCIVYHVILKLILTCIISARTCSKTIEQHPGELMPERESRQRDVLFTSIFNGDVFSLERNFGLSCDICIVMDKEFFTFHGQRNLSVIKSKLHRMLNYASWIFRSADWNNDGKPDNIGFIIKKVRLNWNPFPLEPKNDYNFATSSMHLLMTLGEVNFSDCCLGLGLTMRKFQKEGQAGSSFTVNGPVGGICNHRTSILQNNGTFSKKQLFTNTILISGFGLSNNNNTNNTNNSLDFSDIVLILIHELGHTFGVTTHDNDINLSDKQNKQMECYGTDPTHAINSPTPTNESRLANGRFIMWVKTTRGKKWLYPNNILFSSCSKQQITSFLVSRRNLLAKCLAPDDRPFCGNGILEEFEECDCGNELTCKQDNCCGSRSSASPCQLINKNLAENQNDSNAICPMTYRTYSNFNSQTFNDGKSRELPLEILMYNLLIFICNSRY